MHNTADDKNIVCRWLAKNKHLRYMWIPYTDTVVVVKCNETKKTEAPKPGMFSKVHSEGEKLEPLRKLLVSTGAEVQVRSVHLIGVSFDCMLLCTSVHAQQSAQELGSC